MHLRMLVFDIGKEMRWYYWNKRLPEKSTILKIITGVLAPTAGTVTVNGRISALLELSRI